MGTTFDDWLVLLGLALLGGAVVMLSWIVHDVKTDIELLRITAAVPGKV